MSEKGFEGPWRQIRRNWAKRGLVRVLGNGPMRAEDVRACLPDMHVSWRTAKRAKRELGIVSFQTEGCWWWELPPSLASQHTDR